MPDQGVGVAHQRLVRLGLIVAAVVLVADQASKLWIVYSVMAPPRVIEVTGFFNLVLAWNKGISFSLFDAGGAAGRWILVAIAVAIVAVLLVWLRRADRRLVSAGIGLVIGGALGNVLDRARVGAVVDFLDFHWGAAHWPAFNLADSAITVGVVALLWDSLFGRRESHK